MEMRNRNEEAETEFISQKEIYSGSNKKKKWIIYLLIALNIAFMICFVVTVTMTSSTLEQQNQDISAGVRQKEFNINSMKIVSLLMAQRKTTPRMTAQNDLPPEKKQSPLSKLEISQLKMSMSEIKIVNVN